MSKAVHTDTKLRDVEIVNKLRKGITPTRVIDWVVDEYGIAKSSASSLVYKLNNAYRKSIKELCDEAAEYIKATLIAEIEECDNAGDKKNKLKAIELLAKTCKVGESDGKLDVNVTFDFNTDDE